MYQLAKKDSISLIIILISFILSIFISINTLNKNDKNSLYDGKTYHLMIKADPLRYLSNGAEIKDEIIKGKKFLRSGGENYTKYLPSRLAATYYLIFDRDLFNNLDDRTINIGIHLEYLIIQCLIYFFSILILYLVIKKRFDQKITKFIIIFLCLEPTIFQYHASFWSESIFFSLQILVLALLLMENKKVLGFILLGVFAGVLSLQKQMAIFYIIPLIIYVSCFSKKKIISITPLIIGYLIIQIFLGYVNYKRSGKFYVMTADTKINLHHILVSSVMSKKLNISSLEFNIMEGNVVSEWMHQNKIQYSNKNKFITKENNFVDWLDYRREILKESDKVLFDNYISSRTVQFFKKYPLIFLNQIIIKSFHTALLNPFHIYYDNKFRRGEVYYKSNTHQKLIPIRVIYSISLYLICLFGLFTIYKKRDYKLLTAIILSVAYFYFLVSWHGNTRYFVPVVIYLSFLFSFGLNGILEKRSNKINQIK